MGRELEHLRQQAGESKSRGQLQPSKARPSPVGSAQSLLPAAAAEEGQPGQRGLLSQHLTSWVEIPQEVKELPPSRGRLVWRRCGDHGRDVVASQKVQQVICLRRNTQSSQAKPSQASSPPTRPKHQEVLQRHCQRLRGNS